MQRSRWVLRQADALDGRLWRLSLTPKGQAPAGQAQQVQNEVVAAMVAGAEPAELRVVTQAMQRASVALEGLLGRMLQPEAAPPSKAATRKTQARRA